MIMFFLFFTLVALATATPDYESPHYVSSGTSQQYRTQDASGNYRFGYDESHASGGTFRDETGDAWGNKYGSYGLREADGRYRVVHYVADEKGFRAEVKTNEPGVAPKDPSATTIKKPFSHEPVVQQVIQEPVQVVHEPVSIKQVIREPVRKQVVREPVVQQQVEQEPIEQKPVLYAPPVTSVVSTPVIHHSYNPEYPLLYSHHNPYYGSYGTYKGTPFRTIPQRFSSYYKGSPYYKGSSYIRHSAPYVTNHGYYIYP